MRSAFGPAAHSGVAQLVARRTLNAMAEGSSPSPRAILSPAAEGGYRPACKAVKTGSTPVRESMLPSPNWNGQRSSKSLNAGSSPVGSATES